MAPAASTPLELVYGFGPRDVTLGKSFFVTCKCGIFPMDYHVIRVNKTKEVRYLFSNWTRLATAA